MNATPPGTRLINHPNWLVRRGAQLFIFFGLIGQLLRLLIGASGAKVDSRFAEQVGRIYVSVRLSKSVQELGIVRRFCGLVIRSVLMVTSAAIKICELDGGERRDCLLRIDGPVDQIVLRNLLIWRNEILAPGLPRDDTQAVDVAFVLDAAAPSMSRLADLMSVSLLLRRIRNVAIFPDVETAKAALAPYRPGGVLTWANSDQHQDLCRIPGQIVAQASRPGRHRGIVLAADGRKQANDFCKMAMPNKLVVAVGLREAADGAVEKGEFDRWIAGIEAVAARHPTIGFVFLNRADPSLLRQRRTQLRFVRHEGQSLQHAICLAQIADCYVGVMDIFGLAALGAGRPGIYAPLDAGAPPARESDRGAARSLQIIAPKDDPDDVLKAFEGLIPALQDFALLLDADEPAKG
jgi:hypothetical protein